MLTSSPGWRTSPIQPRPKRPQPNCLTRCSISPYPLDQMLEEFKVTATGRACSMIQPAAKDVEGEQITVRPQKCVIGGRCDACVVGAHYSDQLLPARDHGGDARSTTSDPG